MKDFPGKLKIDSKGMMTFTDRQWDWLLKFKNSKAQTFRAQQRVIRKLIIEALKLGLKQAK